MLKTRFTKWFFIRIGILFAILGGLLLYYFYLKSLPYEIIYPKVYAQYVDKCAGGTPSEQAFDSTIMDGFVRKLGLQSLLNAKDFTAMPVKEFSELSYNVDLLEQEKDIVTEIIEETVKEIGEYFPGEPKKYFYVLPGRFYDYGSFGGCALNENLFLLFIEESLYETNSKDRLRATIAHEYTHTCDPDMMKEHLTLGNLAVMEGKAQYVSTLLVEYERKRLDDNVINLTTDMIFDMKRLQWDYYDSPEAYAHYQTAEFYAFGYKVVREYARAHPELSVEALVTTDHHVILEEFKNK